MSDNLKVFVWDDRFACDYSCGLAVAIAHDSDEARVMISEQLGYEDSALAKPPKVFELSTAEPTAWVSSGGG